MAQDTPQRTYMLRNATTTGAMTGQFAYIDGITKIKTYDASGATTNSTGAATILIQGSNNEGASWADIGTITLTLGTTRTSDGFTSDDRYHRLRGYVSAISGTGANVELIVSY